MKTSNVIIGFLSAILLLVGWGLYSYRGELNRNGLAHPFLSHHRTGCPTRRGFRRVGMYDLCLIKDPGIQVSPEKFSF